MCAVGEVTPSALEALSPNSSTAYSRFGTRQWRQEEHKDQFSYITSSRPACSTSHCVSENKKESPKV